MPDDIRSIISSGNIASIFGLYSFYHQSCTPSTLLLQKEIYPRKYFANPNSKFTNTYKRDHPEKDGLFTFMRKMNYSLNLAARNSLFKRAICSTEIPLGHSISQALVLVQLPKPSSSIFATIARALLAASGRP